MHRRSSTPARATPSCSTAPSSTSTTPRRTTSTRCSTERRFTEQTKTPALGPAFFVGLSRYSRPRRAADVDHVAVAGAGVLVDEAGDHDAAVKGDDLAVLLAGRGTGRADIV